MKSIHVIVLVLLANLAFSSISSKLHAQENQPEWAKKLPANKWTKIDQAQSGNRINAQVFWLQKEEKLVLVGGGYSPSNRESPKPNKMIFDAKTNAWQEYKNEPVLPETKTLKIIDSTKKLTIEAKLPSEFDNLAGTKNSTNTPLVNVSKIYDPLLEGSIVFFNPIHKEVNLVGGAVGSADNGEIGNWRYSLETNSWQKNEAISPFAKNQKEILDLKIQIKNAAALARNIHFSSNMTDYLKTTYTIDSLTQKVTLHLKSILALSEQSSKWKSTEDLSQECILRSNQKIKSAAEKTQNAFNELGKKNCDPNVIALLEDASWLLDEAYDFLSIEPTPRLNAMGIYDPERKIYILHGGDHGDYMLSDTWHFDMKSKKWKRVFPKFAPSARFGGQMYYLPQTKSIALLGGKIYLSKMVYQTFHTNLEPDIWVYNPEDTSWQVLVKPGDEIKEKSPDGSPWFIINNPVVMTQYSVLICPATGGNTYHDFLTSSTWMLKIDANAGDKAQTEKFGLVGGERVYRSQMVDAYNPKWYDSAPRQKASDIDKLIETMPINQWVRVPEAARPCPERSWGTSLYDIDRDQIYFWTGGHCADPADIVHNFHPAFNSWSIPYVAGGAINGNQFTNRPDCNNHTYKNYAYDTVTKKIVASHRAGTHVYDPDVRDWVGYTKEQPFPYNMYSSKLVSTPKGVVAWAGGCSDGPNHGIFFEIFDAQKLVWTKLNVKGGTVPANIHGDEGGLTWDSKRKLLYINAGSAYLKPNGKIHQYSFETQELKTIEPKNNETIGDKFYTYRETVYLPKEDLILYGMAFINNSQVFYDPENNKWLLSNITKTSAKASFDANTSAWSFAAPKADKEVGSITFCPTYDVKRNVLWAPSDYKTLYVIKLDKSKLVFTDGAK